MTNPVEVSPQAAMKVCADVKARCARLVGNLQKIAASPDPTFDDVRGTLIELILAGHELDAASFSLRKTYWPSQSSKP